MRRLEGLQQPEGYVDRREMARRLGISVSLLDKMVSSGEVPSATWGRRTRRFLPSAVIRALGTNDARLDTEEGARPNAQRPPGFERP